jgi:hypothetical protein
MLKISVVREPIDSSQSSYKPSTGLFSEDPEPVQPSSSEPPNPCYLPNMAYYMALTWAAEPKGEKIWR